MSSLSVSRFSTPLFFALIGICACSNAGNYLEQQERSLGTHSDLNRSFHVVADEPQGFGLRMEGFLIGIEKSDRKILAVPPLNEDPHLQSDSDAFEEEEVRKDYRRRLDDGKRTFISHVVQAQLADEIPVPYIRNAFLYDAYCTACEDTRRPSKPSWSMQSESLYEKSWEVLEKLEREIEQALVSAATQDAPYSHIVIGTMGWNTPQEKAVRNLNSIFGNILLANKNGFKPLYIALTWPSEWNAPGVSLTNKANDADEIGFVWANALINGHLSSLRARASESTWPEFRIVSIGHSLGARMMTRAAFSGSALKPAVALEDGLDLVIGLQGAFSMNRFLAERKQGREGAPYSEYGRLRGRIALTWSAHDSATPKSNFLSGANYAGAKAGYKRAREYPRHFAFYTASETGELIGDDAQNEVEKPVIYVDATELVRYEVLGTGGGAHSDIYNAHMGKLLGSLITGF